MSCVGLCDNVNLDTIIKFMPMYMNKELFKQYMKSYERGGDDMCQFLQSLDYDKVLDMMILCDFVGGEHSKNFMPTLVERLVEVTKKNDLKGKQ